MDSLLVDQQGSQEAEDPGGAAGDVAPAGGKDRDVQPCGGEQD